MAIAKNIRLVSARGSAWPGPAPDAEVHREKSPFSRRERRTFPPSRRATAAPINPRDCPAKLSRSEFFFSILIRRGADYDQTTIMMERLLVNLFFVPRDLSY